MAISSLLSASIPCRSGRPRPLSSSSIVALVGGTAHLCSRFSLCPLGNVGGKLGGGGGGGGRIGGEESGSEDASEVIDALGAETCHSNGNNNGEIEEIRLHYLKTVPNILDQMKNTLSRMDQTMIINILIQLEKRMVTYLNPSTPPVVGANSPTNISAVNEMKGLLGFIYTLVWTMLFFYSALVTFSVTYPGSQKALVSFDDTWTKGICFVNVISWFSGLVMLPFASRFKDGESIDHYGFGVFIWAMYLWLLILIPEYFTTVRIFLHTPNWIVWPFGIAVFCLTVIPSVVYIESQQPTHVSKWTKYMWEKITCRSSDPTSSSCAIGLEGQAMYRANV